jgi:hypothetical protein
MLTVGFSSARMYSPQQQNQKFNVNRSKQQQIGFGVNAEAIPRIFLGGGLTEGGLCVTSRVLDFLAHSVKGAYGGEGNEIAFLDKVRIAVKKLQTKERSEHSKILARIDYNESDLIYGYPDGRGNIEHQVTTHCGTSLEDLLNATIAGNRKAAA